MEASSLSARFMLFGLMVLLCFEGNTGLQQGVDPPAVSFPNSFLGTVDKVGDSHSAGSGDTRFSQQPCDVCTLGTLLS